ncbi:MAG: ribosomal protein methylthiotransferase accessory factor [Blastocatellia bacterium]
MISETFRLQNRQRSDLQQTLQTLPYLLDRQVGVIQSIEYYPVRYNDPQFVHCHAMMADVSRFTGRSSNRSNGGTALTEDAAMAKAIGESVERYSADVYLPEVLRAAYRDVKDRAIDPRRFALFHPSQYGTANFPFAPLKEDTEIGWVEGFSLSQNKPVLVPALLADIGYTAHSHEEIFELSPVSGYACGNTLEEAILNGLYEVVERDSFMVFWYNWLPVPAIDLRSFAAPQIKQVLDRYHSAPVRIFCSSITTDTQIPAVLAVMTSRQPGWPAAIVATAADLDMERAVIRALFELSANHLFIRSVFEAGHPVPRTPQQVSTQEDHGLFYCTAERLAGLDPVLRPRWQKRAQDFTPKASADVKTNIDTCVRQLADLGLEAIAVEITASDVSELGFRVVKVLVPGMQPIDFGMQWPHLGGRRLYEAPRRAGYKQIRTQPWEMNLFPHPFP